MTAVIFGLVAVVLLVLVVVALGMRSMNRRESALSADRIKAMAENKGPKRARPAEETFFESFPEGFDAFEEPAGKANRTRPPRPAPRPGGRQAAKGEARGRRGVDEWGDQDDYDDDYWTRVRADEGGFGGSVHARMAAPRPMTAQERLAQAPSGVDPDAATVQAPLPKRPTPAPAPSPAPALGLADLVEPPRAAATGPVPVAPAPAPVPDPYSTDAFSTGAVVSPFAGTGAFNGTGNTAHSNTGPFASAGNTGPFASAGSTNPNLVAPLRATPASAAAEQKTQTFAAPTPDVLAALGTQATGPQPVVDPSQPPPSVQFTASTDAFERGRVADPFYGGNGSYPAQGTGPFSAASPSAYAAEPNGASYQHTPPSGFPQATGPFETQRPAAYEPAASYDAYAPSAPAAAPTPEPAAPWPTAYHSDPHPSWPNGSPVARDVLDDPEPPRSYQQPAYEGYSSAYGATQPTPYPSNGANYEVSNGWATIDDSDTVNAGRSGTPYEPAAYEPASYEQQPAQPAPSAANGSGGGWPSYDELYGTNNGAQRTGSRRGSHRTPDSDYPDYYR